MNKFKQLCKGYGLVDHESFCVVTNEGGALISVANLAVVVNTNICSWVTHSSSSIYRVCRLRASVHGAVTCTGK